MSVSLYRSVAPADEGWQPQSQTYFTLCMWQVGLSMATLLCERNRSGKNLARDLFVVVVVVVVIVVVVVVVVVLVVVVVVFVVVVVSIPS